MSVALRSSGAGSSPAARNDVSFLRKDELLNVSERFTERKSPIARIGTRWGSLFITSSQKDEVKLTAPDTW